MSMSVAHIGTASRHILMAQSTSNTKFYRIFVFVLLMVIWVVLSGFFDVFHLSLGLISCAIVVWLSSDLLFENRHHRLNVRIKQAFGLFAYSIWMIGQIILSNIYVLRLALGSTEKLEPQIVRYKCSLNTDFQRFLLANSITLTPGTVTIKIIGDTYYVHAISDETANGLDGTMERRIKKVFADEYKTSKESPA
ncbi:MAG: cation transporter [Verrucomicrobiales bacterium]|nr:cation transporter [Verrucomicrobiales bacterium]